MKSVWQRIELWGGFLATILIVLGMSWAMWIEPARMTAATEAQLARDLDDAMTVYAQNCAVCHGLSGEGIAAIPALDNPALSESDPDSLEKIISRGLYNTAMPAWNKSDGGPLSDYQIGELVSLIQYGDWQAVQDRVINLGMAPRVPFVADPDPAVLETVALLPQGDVLAQGITLYAENCVACHGSDGVGTALAPALNSPDLRARDSAELERTIRLGVSSTLMAGWQAVLEDGQINALMTLLLRWEEVPAGAIPAPVEPLPTTVESLALGGELFSANCARCHGSDGQGTPRAPALNAKSFLTETNDQAIKQIITAGVPGTAMPAWGDRLSEAEIFAITGFIRAWEPTAPEVAAPVLGGGAPWWNTQNSPNAAAPTPWWQTPVPVATAAPAEVLPAQPSQESVDVQPEPTSAATETAPVTPVMPVEPGGGPPWAQTVAPVELPWWQTIQPAAWILIGGIAGAALILLGIGLVLYRRAETITP